MDFSRIDRIVRLRLGAAGPSRAATGPAAESRLFCQTIPASLVRVAVAGRFVSGQREVWSPNCKSQERCNDPTCIRRGFDYDRAGRRGPCRRSRRIGPIPGKRLIRGILPSRRHCDSQGSEPIQQMSCHVQAFRVGGIRAEENSPVAAPPQERLAAAASAGKAHCASLMFCYVLQFIRVRSIPDAHG